MLKFNNRTIMAKIETAYGTDAGFVQVGEPQESDSNNTAMITMATRFIPNQGNDEFRLRFT